GQHVVIFSKKWSEEIIKGIGSPSFWLLFGGIKSGKKINSHFLNKELYFCTRKMWTDLRASYKLIWQKEIATTVKKSAKNRIKVVFPLLLRQLLPYVQSKRYR